MDLRTSLGAEGQQWYHNRHLCNLVLLCRRHHVLWHLGKTDLDDLHVPWLRTGSRAGPPGRSLQLART